MKRLALLVTTLVLTLPGCKELGDEDSADTGDTGDDGDKPMLGASPSGACEAVIFDLDQLVAENRLPTPSAEFARSLYFGDAVPGDEESPQSTATPLQGFVRDAGAELGRVEDGVLTDDAAILAALESGAPEDLIAVQWRITMMLSLIVRARLYTVAESQADTARDPALLYAAWDEAYCLWDGGLRALAEQADALPEAPSYDTFTTDIETAFTDGHAGIESDEASWAVEPFVVKPAKQIAEKSTFVVAARLVVAHAKAAQAGDTRAAMHALGAFGVLEDRILGRNTPGIEIIRTMLAGEPTAIDPSVIEQEIAIAFVKRARKYCDEAVELGALGSADGVKGAWEGIIYTRAILPAATRLVPSTDAEAWLATWDTYREAILADDPTAAIDASQTLVDLDCAVQAALGIAMCTATADEFAE